MELQEYQMCTLPYERKCVSTGIKHLASTLGKRSHYSRSRRLAFTEPNDVLLRERCICFEEHTKQL